MTENVNYYAVIPADVRYDNRLSSSAKLFYGEITALANKSGYCFAANKYFMDLYEVSDRAIRMWIEQLKSYGYIFVEYENNDNSARKIFISARYSIERELERYKKQLEEEYKEKASKHLKTKEQEYNPIKEIVSFLNETAHKNFKYTTSKTQSFIKARMNEGYSVDDFKTVITKKCKEWTGTKMEKYIRPETLFGNKFEGYLNEVNTYGNSRTNTVASRGLEEDSWGSQLDDFMERRSKKSE